MQWRTQSGLLCAVICGDDFLTSALVGGGERENAPRAPREFASALSVESGDTAKLSERQRVKGRLPIYLRRPRGIRGRCFATPPSIFSKGECTQLFLISMLTLDCRKVIKKGAM